LPFDTESVHAIFSSHMVEHLTYKEGLAFLKECRRVLRPDGAMRIIVPDACSLINSYTGKDYCNSQGVPHNYDIADFDELSGTCAAAKTDAAKLYELLHAHHHSMYDYETMHGMVEEAGLQPYQSWFRKCALVQGRGSDMQVQILKETTESIPDISLFVEAYVPTL
jgi:predicted SAM-dependent methyltransferase